MPEQRPTRRRELLHWRSGARSIVGLDEVGRGPLAGPIATAAVSLPLDRRAEWVSQLRDSKRLTALRRERLTPEIHSGALQWAIGWVHAFELDELGMTAALRLAARRAIEQLPTPPEIVLADGRDDLRLPWPTEMIIRGDGSVSSIAAASIIAKTARDAWMIELDQRYPAYGFARHKGYGTPEHRRALKRSGPCPEHRRSFAPVSSLVQPRLAFDAPAS